MYQASFSVSVCKTLLANFIQQLNDATNSNQNFKLRDARELTQKHSISFLRTPGPLAAYFLFNISIAPLNLHLFISASTLRWLRRHAQINPTRTHATCEPAKKAHSRRCII